MANLTRRFAPDLEVRDDGTGRRVFGIAAPFDQPARVDDGHGPFTEVIRRGAFAKTIRERGDRVKLLSQHKRTENPLCVFEELREDNDERVDERAYARARLFDMLIGDWDRGYPQWRWAEFDYEHGTRYVAVPRDRDYAFARFDGTLFRLGRRTGNTLLRRFTNFEGPIKDLVGMNWQGAGLDHRLTASLTREDWSAIADSLQAALTDEVIRTAIRAWPEDVYEEVGPGTIRTLQTRRDQLTEVAARYYDLLAEVVDVVGSDKHERFEAQRLGDGTMAVTMYKTEDDGEVERVLYRRIFHPDETREVRLYGLGGKDRYVVTGEAAYGPRLRLLGGQGEDAYTVTEEAEDDVVVYDTASDTDLNVASGVNVQLSHRLPASRYSLRFFTPETALSPLTAFDYDSDYGVVVGGGVALTRHAFRKEPYAARHALTLRYAPRSEAFAPRYVGYGIDRWQGADVRLEAEALLADNYRSFFGLGNETRAEDRPRYHARLRTATATAVLRYAFGKASIFEVGPRFAFIDADPPDGLRPEDALVAYTPEQLENASFAGLRTRMLLDTRDTSRTQARSGLVLRAETQVNLGVRGTEERFARLAGEARFYQALHPTVPLTLALRVGGATNVGDFTFYQASTLGGHATLRGYPRTRFAGRSTAFANAEVRARLSNLNAYVVRGELGVLGFVDTGRVWADGETSDVWHQGYGGGLWFRPFGVVTLVGTLGISDEGHVFDLSSRFFF